MIDPRWDIDVYLDIARQQRVRIAHVLETHNHADHVSGRSRLVTATGARAYRPDLDHDRPDSISPDHEIVIGKVRIRAIATPGHRPEHLAYEVVDTKRSGSPWMLLTGDTLLVGDVARPDLAYEPTTGATALHRTLGHLTSFTDYVEVWPAHVGGSLCGGAGLSGKTSSTVGFERHNNPLLTLELDEFVDGLTTSLPTRPPNVDRIVSLNQRADLQPPTAPPELSTSQLRELLTAGATILDSRLPEDFDLGHLAGSVNLPVDYSGAGTRAGWTLEPEQELAIVARDGSQARAMITALQAVGFFAISGYALANREVWERDGLPIGEIGAWDLDQLADGLRADAVELVDVREPSEWATGHVRGSHHVPLHRLRDLDSLPIPDNGHTTVVACAAGARAAFAASLMRRAGRDAIRLAGGGVPDLSARGIELERGTDSRPAPVATS